MKEKDYLTLKFSLSITSLVSQKAVNTQQKLCVAEKKTEVSKFKLAQLIWYESIDLSLY